MAAQVMACEPVREIYLAGAGSFAQEVAEWAEDAGWAVAGLVELLDRTRAAGAIGGRPVAGGGRLPPGSYAVIAAGGERPSHPASLPVAGWRAATVVPPRAHVSRSAILGAGAIVGPGAVVGAEVVIGEHSL